MRSRKYALPPPPATEGIGFSGGEGVNLPNFPVGREGHHREIFPEGKIDNCVSKIYHDNLFAKI